MRRHTIDLAVLFVLATVTMLCLLLALPGDRSVVLRVYVLVVGVLLVGAVLAGLASAAPASRRSELKRALDERPEQPTPVSQLARVQREVTLATGNAYDLHTRLLPHLREIAEARLERSGRRPGPDTLGRWWELLRPDRPDPANRFGPGIAESELRALVSDLERL